MAGPETRIVTKIRTALRDRGAWMVKLHGEAMQLRGLPDLLVCYKGVFVAMEAKVPGREATDLQRDTLEEIEKAGGVACTVHSPQEAIAILDMIDKRTTECAAHRRQIL